MNKDEAPDSPATKKDIDDLRTELQELKKLLKAAAAYDAASGQPECEQEEKIALIRKMAEIANVDMEDCLPKKPEPVLLKDARQLMAKPFVHGDTTIGDTVQSNCGQDDKKTKALSIFAKQYNLSPPFHEEPRKPWASRDDGSHP